MHHNHKTNTLRIYWTQTKLYLLDKKHNVIRTIQFFFKTQIHKILLDSDNKQRRIHWQLNADYTHNNNKLAYFDRLIHDVLVTLDKT